MINTNIKKSLFSELVQSVRQLISYPRYPGYAFALILDTFGRASAYQLLGFVLHPIDGIFRFFFKSKLPHPDTRIDRNVGFVLAPKLPSDVIDRAANYCIEVFKLNENELKHATHRKSFLQQIWLDTENEKHAPVWDLACNPQLISIISDYLGFIPILNSALIWYSPNQNFVEGRSQMFHLDGEGVKLIKVFVNLSDIDIDSGPLHVVESGISKEIYSKLKESGAIPRRNTKIQDSAVTNLTDKSNIKVVTGPIGELALVDTDSCYHFGSRPGQIAKSRLVLQLHYTSPHCIHQPLFLRKCSGKIKEMYQGYPDYFIRKLVLGFEYLAFPKLRGSTIDKINLP